MDEASRVKAGDPFGVADIFVSGLAEVEDLGGGVLRFVFFAKQHTNDAEERIVVAKLIMPADALPAAVLQSAKAAGMAVAMELRNVH